MNELIAALTELAKKATLYLRRENHPMIYAAAPGVHVTDGAAYADEAAVVGVGSGFSEIPPAATAEKKKAGRPSKAVKPEPAAPVISEDESLAIALATAKEYVQRFQKASPDGLTKARAILAEHFKVGAIPALTHPQRVELIGMLKKELEAA